MLEDTTTFAPFRLDELEARPGRVYVSLSDVDMAAHEALFEAHDRVPNGYAWSDVALAAMRAEAPELEARVDMDPEAGTFSASGSEADMRALAALLHRGFHAPKELAVWVEAAPWEFD